MNGITGKHGRAFAEMTSDIVTHVLAHSDDLPEVVADLMEWIRQLSGARTVIMIQSLVESGESPLFRVLGVDPERRMPLVESAEMIRLIKIACDLSETVLWRPDEKGGEAESTVALLDCGPTLAVPLLAGAARVGVVLILGLRDDRYLGSIAEAQDALAKTVALILRNSVLIEDLKRAIDARERAEKDRRALETQVQHVQKLESLGVLAGGIAHDFNNLLMAILGNADLAMQDLSPVSPVREYLVAIDQASRRAADLCKQMLAYSGKGRFIVEALSLSEVVEEMAHMLEISVSKKAVLKYNFAENLPAIEADATQMRQIIMNLITNASEAIGDTSGVISISTGAMDCDRDYLRGSYLDEEHPPGLYTYIEVSDTGVGMDKEIQAKLFDPFFTTKFTGRGLGLSAVLGIVRGHGGAIKIYSELRKGTTFKVLFPAVKEKAVRLPDDSDAEAWRGGGTVLLIDDEESVRAIGANMLRRAGFEVLTAEDGRAGLELYEKHAGEIVCVLLDLTMPHMDGEECFRELRRINKDVRVVMSSGYNEQEVLQRFAGKRLAGFIQKPYRTRTLAKALKRALEA